MTRWGSLVNVTVQEKVLETECFDDTQKTKTPSGDIHIIRDQTMLS